MSQGTNLGSQKGRWIILAALVAVLGALLFLLPGGLAQAQQTQQSFTYAENGTSPVATFAATDPEGVTPIVWSLLEEHDGTQDLGIFTDSQPDGVDDDVDDVMEVDVADFGEFEISQSGVLTFASPPDYEMPREVELGAQNTNTYRVVVQASDGGVGSFVNWFKVIVTVTDVEEEGTVAEWTVDADGNAGTTQTTDQLLQFQPEATLTVVPPTDSDGGVTNVRWQWYRTPSKSAMGTAIDDATGLTYTVSDTSTSNDVGMYLRVVATYSDRRGPNKTASDVSENPVQAARDDNTAPEFALTAETRGITENTVGNVGSPLTATDDDGDILTYSIAGVGANNVSFTINRATGQLMVAGLDFENPGATDNTYVVTMVATDSHGIDSDTVTVTISVADVNEPPMFTIGIEGGIEGMAPDHREDSLSDSPPQIDLTISTYVATDPEGADVTLSLTGDDAAIFELADDTLVTGADAANASQVLSFKEMPDFEMPGDQNGDNVYQVTVRASDGVLSADRMMTVKVTDADEAGEVDLSSQDAMIGIELTATLTDSDTGAPDPARFIDQAWTWHRIVADTAQAAAEVVVGAENAIAGATSSAYTPVVLDRGMYLRAMVSYSDRTRDEDNDPNTNDADDSFVGFMNTATSGVTTAVRNNPSNQAPVFAESPRTVRLVEENTEAVTDPDDDAALADDNLADNVGGGPVIAMDDDLDTVNYTLTGSDMFRVRANGQIEVSDKAELDYETSKSHTVTLTADDGTGERNGTASITVTIHVTDLDEKPTITDRDNSSAVGEQKVDYAENSTDEVIQLAARDPEGGTLIVWSLLENATDVQNLGIEEVPEVLDDVDADDIADRDLFEISQTGELTFIDPPSFEADSASGPGPDAKNYRVVVQASDGGEGSHLNWFKVTVNVTDVPEGGAVAEWTIDPDGASPDVDPGPLSGGQNLLQFNANATLVAGALSDGDGLTGNVQWQWFRSSNTSKTGGTAIAGANTNTYSVADTPANPNDVGKYLRVQATYTVGTGSSEMASFVSINPVQATRLATNTDPQFVATEPARRIQEDTVGNVGAPIRATDADRGDILTYSLTGGDDIATFDIDRANGQLTVAAGELDYEAAGTDNVYDVMVTATDSSGGSAVVPVTITVTDVNEAPTFGIGTEGMADDHTELTGPVTDAMELDISTYTATDPEGAEVTLSLMGDDAALFELADDSDDGSAATQVLSFKERPDFEMPADRNDNNVYQVTVRASDSVLNADRMVTIKVIDSDELGEVKVPQDALIGVELTATLTDSDTGAPNTAQFIDQVWTWHRLAMASEVPVVNNPDAPDDDNDNEIEGATSDTYTPVVADRGMYLRAMVSYSDRTRDENYAENFIFVGFMNTATSNATTAVRDNPSNQAPVFAESPRTVRLVEENTKALSGASTDDDADDDELPVDNPADNVGGGPVTATDADQGQEVAYTLTGSDMFRVRNDGQIEVSDKANLDYETSKSHTVILTATDTSSESNNSATIEVTIHVTDLDERPVISEGGLAVSGPGSPTFPENDGTSAFATYTAVGPDAATARLRLGGDDAGDFSLSGGDLSFRISPDYENPADSDRNNTYSITINATDRTFTASQSVTVTVTNVDELGRLSGQATASHMENSTDDVGTYTASGGSMSDVADWSLMGDDMGDLSISASGVLTFDATPDYEMPMDADTDNTYMVTVKAEAGGEMDTVDVTVTVTNEDEDGMVTLTLMRPSVGTEITATLTDPDMMVTGTTWQWAKSMTTDGTYMDMATSMSYTPMTADVGYYLRATVIYTDGHGPGKMAMETTTSMVTAGDPLLAEYDDNNNGMIDKTEIITAINDYLGFGAGSISKAEMIDLINLYLGLT